MNLCQRAIAITLHPLPLWKSRSCHWQQHNYKMYRFFFYYYSPVLGAGGEEKTKKIRQKCNSNQRWLMLFPSILCLILQMQTLTSTPEVGTHWNWWRGCVATLWPTCFQLAFTRRPFFFFFFDSFSSNDPLFDNSQHIFSKSLTEWPPLWHHFVKIFNLYFQNYCQKWTSVQICILPGMLAKICLTVWPPIFWSSHWMNPLFREKALTERSLVSSSCPSTPVTS